MERKTSATEEDGEEDISHGGRRRGREQQPTEGLMTVPIVQPRSVLKTNKQTNNPKKPVEVVIVNVRLNERNCRPSRGQVCHGEVLITFIIIIIIIIIIINPLTATVFGAPQMILQPFFSIFPCSPLPSRTCRTPGLSIP